MSGEGSRVKITKSPWIGNYYTVTVSNHVDNVCMSPTVTVQCMVCNSVITLQRGNKFDRCTPFILSNWTRHVKKCIVKQLPKLSPQQQTTTWDFLYAGS